MKKAMKKLEEFLELGGIKKDITLLVIGGIALLLSIFHVSPLPFDLAWISIILCGVPIILTKVGKDSSIQRMIQLVQSADAGKTKIVGIADRWATWIVVIALSAATFTCIISGELIRAVTILVVFCPCALVLATPTAIMAAIGNATKHGFLVRASIGKSSSKLLQRVLSEKSAGSRKV